MKHLHLMLLLLGALLFGAGCARQDAPAAPPPPLTFEGRLIELSPPFLTVEDSKGERHVFSLPEEAVISGEGPAGRRVRLTGEGILLNNQSEQTARILTVSIVPPTRPERASELLLDLTLEQKVGQLFIARCPEVGALEQAAQYQPGGFILFARDFEGQTPERVSATIANYKRAVAVPMFIGVDEEGGVVNRVSRYKAFRAAPFASPQQLYRNGGFERIAADAEEKALLLTSLGINLNFAPVCDLSTSPNDYIYSRTLGRDAQDTARFVETVVEANSRFKMGSVLKHFPGYGNNRDTHTGGARDQRDYDTFLTADFIPFSAGIEAGAGMVLVSHNTVVSMDSERPASLSPEVHRILREELGFEGVIVTDDLVMQAVTSIAPAGEAAVLAFEAGNDLLCSSELEVQYTALLEAVQGGRISAKRLDESVARILALKLELGLLA